MKIIAAKWYHSDALTRLRRLAWIEETAADPSLTPESEAKAAWDMSLQVAGWLGNPNAAVLLAMDSPTEALGYLCISNGKTCPYRQEPTIFVDGFYVVPEARKRHVAGLLYRAAYRIVQGNPPKYVQAVTLAGNSYMLGILQRHGFKLTGILLERGV